MVGGALLRESIGGSHTSRFGWLVDQGLLPASWSSLQLVWPPGLSLTKLLVMLRKMLVEVGRMEVSAWAPATAEHLALSASNKQPGRGLLAVLWGHLRAVLTTEARRTMG